MKSLNADSGESLFNGIKKMGINQTFSRGWKKNRRQQDSAVGYKFFRRI